ncbi:4-hydroxyphenylpyruvate dioxygenase [Amycolatopsis roodepoortensis]|uniref:4-hydroxymandelate synthase n=1 Tax=Amycolatopsis roodepoortensis TaxID=700274 RepID=A0ABR9L6G0_9PSEU|nr:4-hydroxyphenylpyruvate dioxygenase [Amycolatopsis roodepoortensis]MBE1576301.1 4-hydroxymandelate synthase [Amycolatopsis roodepoortensis]
MATFDDLTVDHVKIYTSDAGATADWLAGGFGLAPYAESYTGDPDGTRLIAVGRSDIRLILAEPRSEDQAGSFYLARHGDGVGDIALGVPDAAAAFDDAVARGARPVAGVAETDGVVTATIGGFGDLTHTFVQRPSTVDVRTLPGFRAVEDPSAADVDLGLVDHFAVCVPPGQLEPTVAYYERVLDFRTVFTEKISVGAQAMNSKVVESLSGAVTFTVIEPDVSRAPGQIDRFLRDHGGAGVQHIAFTATDIVRAVDAINGNGIGFLSTPESYYRRLADRLSPVGHTVDELRRLSILVDEDHDGQLFQIFAKSVHPRNTFFVEIIERLGAQTFGSGNIQALYEAVADQESADRAVGENAA